MILKASQRGGGMDLARHLLKDENDHVTVHEIRGFVSETVTGAFKEAYAISKGTQCKQFLFSLSLNPPDYADVGENVFVQTADETEKRLGLDGQPRVIVYHEKEGRRHAHVVWSRIDAQQLKAINLSYFKNKLTALSKELYLENGWDLPKGFRDPALSNPLNFTLAEWQEAARNDRDPREIKQLFQKAWTSSDGAKAFAASLAQSGFVLARGDRRGYVAVDYLGGIYAIPKYTGLRTKAVRERLGDPQELPSIEEAKVQLKQSIKPALKTLIDQKQERYEEIADQLKCEVKEMAYAHKKQRHALELAQDKRAAHEQSQRQLRFSSGMTAVWDALTGKRQFIKQQNELEAWDCAKRDQKERDGLVFEQIHERQDLQHRIKNARADYQYDRKAIGKQIGAILTLDRDKIAAWQNELREREPSRDNMPPNQYYGRDGPSFF